MKGLHLKSWAAVGDGELPQFPAEEGLAMAGSNVHGLGFRV